MSKTKILSKINKNSSNKVALKEIDIKATTYEDKIGQFCEALKSVGGEVVFDETQNIQNYFNNKEIAIIEALFGVAENGACWIKHQKDDDRKNYTFYENLAIILKKENILNNMHEAYSNIVLDDFGLFISGASKTADIEQSLVIGAHGAKVTKIFLI